MRPAQRVKLGNVDKLTHRTVGLGGIELYNPLEAYSLDDQFGEFADGQFLAGADIDVAVAYLA